MNLDEKERLVLLMLCDIAQSVGAKEFDYKMISAAVAGGHDWALDMELVGGVIPRENVPKQTMTEVLDILDMWSFIEQDFQALSSTDQQKVKDAYGMEPKFLGFDGNNETEHMSVARMLIEKMDRFTNFSGRSLNSHSPTLHSSIPAAERFKEIRHQIVSPTKLSAEQIIEVLCD